VPAIEFSHVSKLKVEVRRRTSRAGQLGSDAEDLDGDQANEVFMSWGNNQFWNLNQDVVFRGSGSTYDTNPAVQRMDSATPFPDSRWNLITESPKNVKEHGHANLDHPGNPLETGHPIQL
jgi:hypothetical protein